VAGLVPATRRFAVAATDDGGRASAFRMP